MWEFIQNIELHTNTGTNVIFHLLEEKVYVCLIAKKNLLVGENFSLEVQLEKVFQCCLKGF